MRQPLHRILAEEAPITPAMALRVGKFCGNGPDLRLRMQQADELWHAQKALRKQLNKIPAAGEGCLSAPEPPDQARASFRNRRETLISRRRRGIA